MASNVLLFMEQLLQINQNIKLFIHLDFAKVDVHECLVKVNLLGLLINIECSAKLDEEE